MIPGKCKASSAFHPLRAATLTQHEPRTKGPRYRFQLESWLKVIHKGGEEVVCQKVAELPPSSPYSLRTLPPARALDKVWIEPVSGGRHRRQVPTCCGSGNRKPAKEFPAKKFSMFVCHLRRVTMETRAPAWALHKSLSSLFQFIWHSFWDSIWERLNIGNINRNLS